VIEVHQTTRFRPRGRPRRLRGHAWRRSRGRCQ
jgi:hypothetical protein